MERTPDKAAAMPRKEARVANKSGRSRRACESRRLLRPHRHPGGRRRADAAPRRAASGGRAGRHALGPRLTACLRRRRPQARRPIVTENSTTARAAAPRRLRAFDFLLARAVMAGPRGRRRVMPRVIPAPHGDGMLSVYVPATECSSRVPIEPGERPPENAVWIDLVSPTRAGRQAGRAPARHRGADARGDAGDRGLEPALCRERRALHDRDADVPVGHRDAEDHARSPSSCPATASSPCATTSRGRSRIVEQQARPRLPGQASPARPC